MDYRQLIEQWLDKLRTGTLVEEDLQLALRRLDADGAARRGNSASSICRRAQQA